MALGWLAGLQAGPSAAQAGDDGANSPQWSRIRSRWFGPGPIETATEAQLSLQAPRRADDPAFVPLTVRSGLGSAVAKLTLVIDENPSPIAAVFELPPNGVWPELETRVRVDAYTYVRVVAETRDGKRYMSSRFVKASGGCSAPAGGDEAEALARIGRMQFRSDGPVRAGEPLTLQWMILHPNHSGMAMNQLTRLYTPAHFVRTLKLWQGDRLLLDADLDFALSENPSLRLRFIPLGDGPLRAEVTDTQSRQFRAEVPLRQLGPA